MAVAAAAAAATATTIIMMNREEDDDDDERNQQQHEDDHEHDMVMPGFRFHPTDEELVEFYLRRKVEGKRFNVELITFLDLYRYDPWELPALAAIGEKEWYFYVPRDRKYRNGDRPNRVTTSGYWKATGADRMIRSENFRAIGLKKTLVFYSGKAPKGIRSSWIMNEYRLPQHETERLQKAEISLCRVHKRAGVEDHPSLPRSLPTRGSSSSSRGGAQSQGQSGNNNNNKKQVIIQDGSSSSNNYSNNNNNGVIIEKYQSHFGGQSSSSHHHQLEEKMSETSGSSNSYIGLSSSSPLLVPPPTFTSIFTGSSNFLHPISSSSSAADDLHGLVNNFQQQAAAAASSSSMPDHHHHQSYHHHHHHHHAMMSFQQPLSLSSLPGSLQSGFSDRLWDWSAITEASKEYNNNSSFK